MQRFFHGPFKTTLGCARIATRASIIRLKHRNVPADLEAADERANLLLKQRAEDDERAEYREIADELDGKRACPLRAAPGAL